MSDFDKEAEREKLREKFERDAEKRKATQQMSELLLKGATMTNRHCDACGDPIFRYEGEEFCPSCGGEQAEQAAEVPERETEVETAQNSIDVEPPAETADAGTGGPEQASGQPGQQDQRTQPAQQNQPVQPNQQDQPVQQTRTVQSSTATQSSQPDQSTSAEAVESAPVEEGTGRDALERALTNAARNAERATDPQSAKAWLEAAREATEALATLDGR